MKKPRKRKRLPRWWKITVQIGEGLLTRDIMALTKHEARLWCAFRYGKKNIKSIEETQK